MASSQDFCSEGVRAGFASGAVFSDGPLAGFMIERVMKIDPKTAVEFKDGERPVSGTVLRPRSRLQRKQQQKRYQIEESELCPATHDELNDTSANSSRAQITGRSLAGPQIAVGR